MDCQSVTLNTHKDDELVSSADIVRYYDHWAIHLHLKGEHTAEILPHVQIFEGDTFIHITVRTDE